MEIIKQLEAMRFDDHFSVESQQQAIIALEAGQVVYLPHLAFALQPHEFVFLSPHYVNPKRKNLSFDGRTDQLGGVMATSEDQAQLKQLLKRFATQARQLMLNLFPYYTANLETERTSFRPVEISNRKLSYRKDDTRLHVDAFPSSPNHGQRILRVFSNINPEGQERVWRIGEPFAAVAKRFLPRIRAPFPGGNALLHLLKITKGKRSAYDHIMLNIHDKMKADMDYQTTVAQIKFGFPPGSTWLVMTDKVSHAAMSGQHLLEQTFNLPVSGMQDESQAPLRILENLLGKKLV